MVFEVYKIISKHANVRSNLISRGKNARMKTVHNLDEWVVKVFILKFVSKNLHVQLPYAPRLGIEIPLNLPHCDTCQAAARDQAKNLNEISAFLYTNSEEAGKWKVIGALFGVRVLSVFNRETDSKPQNPLSSAVSFINKNIKTER